MSIDETTIGRFRVRLTTEPGKRRTLGIFDTREQAETAEAAAKFVLREQRTATLGATIVACLQERRDKGLVRNPHDDESRYRTHLADDPIMRLAVNDVRRRDVVLLVDRLKAKINAHQTLLNVLVVVRNGFNFAVERELIAASPFVAIKLPAPPETEEKWSYATPPEQRNLVLSAPLHYRAIVAFAIATGVRAGELVSLRLEDVHEEAPEPYVTIRYGSPPFGPPKNGRIRRVPLLPLAREAVIAQRALLRAPKGLRPRENPFKLLFPAERGGFRNPDHVLPSATWERIRTPNGIDRLRWHDLRHTCASSLVSGWWGRRWSLEEVCAMLGHSDIRVTQRYAHLAESALALAARQTEGGGGALANASGHDRVFGPAVGITETPEKTPRQLPTSLRKGAVDGTAPFSRRTREASRMPSDASFASDDPQGHPNDSDASSCDSALSDDASRAELDTG